MSEIEEALDELIEQVEVEIAKQRATSRVADLPMNQAEKERTIDIVENKTEEKIKTPSEAEDG